MLGDYYERNSKVRIEKTKYTVISLAAISQIETVVLLSTERSL